jgi:hypothetical protein
MPIRSASVNRVGVDRFAAGGSILAAPSSSEYSEWTCRWTKLSRAAVATSAEGFPQRSRPTVETYIAVIR